MIVLDASVVLEMLLQTETGERLSRRFLQGREHLGCPHLLDLEVAQVLRRYAHSGELDDRRGRQALQDLADLPLTRFPHAPLLLRIWELRQDTTAYDAAYVALAEALAVPLLTRDSRLAAATRRIVKVEVV